MKAIIGVEKLGDDKYLILSKRYGNGQEWLADNEIKIVQDNIPCNFVDILEQAYVVIAVWGMINLKINRRI
jgi:hypothetical protein